MLVSYKGNNSTSITCTDKCYLDINSGKGLLSCKERRLCIAIMRNDSNSIECFDALKDKVDIDKLVKEGYLTVTPLDIEAFTKRFKSKLDSASTKSNNFFNPALYKNHQTPSI